MIVSAGRMSSTIERLWFVSALATSVFAPAPAAAQISKPPAPSYTVSTVRPSDPDSPPDKDDIGFDSSDEFHTVNQSLPDIIKFAYDLSYGADKQVVGGPKWVVSAKFDILAKTDGETAAALRKLTNKQQLAEVRLMVRGLLAERFKLRVHREARTLPIYALVLVKSGSKLTPTKGPQESELIRGASPGHLRCVGCTMKLFADVIAGQREIGGRQIIDRTGLAGHFNFLLTWTPDPTLGIARSDRDSGVAPDMSGPSLFTALQEQLGLKLESTKGSVDVIVIDSVEMPSEN